MKTIEDIEIIIKIRCNVFNASNEIQEEKYYFCRRLRNNLRYFLSICDHFIKSKPASDKSPYRDLCSYYATVVSNRGRAGVISGEHPLRGSFRFGAGTQFARDNPFSAIIGHRMVVVQVLHRFFGGICIIDRIFSDFNLPGCFFNRNSMYVISSGR